MLELRVLDEQMMEKQNTTVSSIKQMMEKHALSFIYRP